MILPSVDRSFEWRTLAGGSVLVSQPLEPHAAHFFTTRAWQLGLRSNPSDHADAWQQIADAAGVAAGRLVRMHQVHGAAVVDASPNSPLQTGDIVMSDDPDLALVVQTADCVPLLFADPDTGAVCAAHAGWRGMAARVPQVAVRAMVSRFRSRPERLFAAVGPSVGACCYEVGGDVRGAFEAMSAERLDPAAWFHAGPVVDVENPPLAGLAAGGRDGRSYFDGWACVMAQLIVAGVAPANIAVARSCTASHPSAFCSYRRDGAPAGRLAAVIRARRR